MNKLEVWLKIKLKWKFLGKFDDFSFKVTGFRFSIFYN